MRVLWPPASGSMVAGSVRSCTGNAGLTARVPHPGPARSACQCYWRGISPAARFCTMLSTFLRCLVLRMMVGGLSHTRPAGVYELWHQNLIDELHVRASSHQEHHLGAGQESFIQLCRPMLCPINSFPARTTGRLHSKAALSLRQPCKAFMLLQACCNLYVVHVAQQITSLPNPTIPAKYSFDLAGSKAP